MVLLRSLTHYWRSHLGLALGAALASTILTGSLLVGDSVKASLRRAGELRLGRVQYGVLGGDRWFTTGLAERTGAAPVILAVGSAGRASGAARANGVQVLGVDEKFFRLSASALPVKLQSGEVAITQALSQKLELQVGSPIILRLEKPSAISRDAPLSGSTDEDIALRRKVGLILAAEDGGGFQLQASQMAAVSAFLPLADLQSQLEMKGRCNVLLSDQPISLQGKAVLEDYALTLKPAGQGAWMLGTDRVFMDEVLVQRLRAEMQQPRGVLTYLVNGIRSAAGGVPYSMVCAVDDPGVKEGVTITQWLAEDQKLKVGDAVDLHYFVMGSGRALTEAKYSTKVAGILPMTDARVNEGWTPRFPGVSESQNCRDWKPGIPMDNKAIRDQDEKYWDDYKGTPKAFLSLAAGQELWRNRFGSLTGLHFQSAEAEQALRGRLAGALELQSLGVSVRAFGAEGQAAARGTVDFGGLFLGLSMFLIAAALTFAALLFLFTLERRASQVGLLLAVGWRVAAVRRSLMLEAGCVGLVGSVMGILGGVAYTKAALAGLNGAWGGATAGMRLSFAAQPQTLLIALAASVLVMLATLWWVSRKLFQQEPTVLLRGEGLVAAQGRAVAGRAGGLPKTMVISALLALGLGLCAPLVKMPEAVAGMFFAAGAALLTALLSAAGGWMRWLAQSAATAESLGQIGLRNVVRRPGRSLAAMGMMAGGIFLVVAVNAFRMSAVVETGRRDTGTGGFSLVGESSLPIYEDLNGKPGREAFGLEEEEMRGVRVVPFRLRDGDDASCLNLNAAQKPQLAGVNAALLAEMGAFSFTQGGWESLRSVADDGAVPAVVDMNTAMWGLKKGVGDVLVYEDGAGRAFEVRIMALLAGSVLQGKVVVDEAAFLQRFPDSAGYRFFLLDGPVAVSEVLTQQLSARGLALEPAVQRLAAYQAVQNTYIGIFTVLGGLGVLLGTLGLGVLVARHVLERKGELGLLQALGFRMGALRGMVLGEHAALLVLGMLCGVLSAGLAVWPSLGSASSGLPVGFICLLLVGILGLGLLICAVAVRVALRGQLLEALRKE